MNKLLQIIAKLRSPEGCPWDKVQTHQSIVKDLLEESAELVDALEDQNDEEIKEELGDLLLQVTFHSQIAQERGAFTFDDVLETICQKLIRRHPHVFGNAHIETVPELMKMWENIKQQEKAGTELERKSALDGIPKTLPALMTTQKLYKKAKKAGLTQSQAFSEDLTQDQVAQQLYLLATYAQEKGWDSETLLRNLNRQQEQLFRDKEKQ